MKRFLIALLLLTTARAQQSAPQPVTGKRVALVIGNNRYTTSPLENCVSDAAAIAQVLRDQLKFDTVLADKDSENLDRLNFTRRLQTFQKEAQGAAVALFYYAGHGMEDFDGRDNYLIPIDANLTEALKDNAGLQAQGISLEQVLKSMKQATQGAKIILLDCCRERPADRAVRTRDGGGFVMPPDADLPQDTLIMLAAAPARTASDGESGHGPFTAALIKHLPTPGTALFQTFRTVRNEVLTATNQQQKPWLKLDGAGDFFYDHSLMAVPVDTPLTTVLSMVAETPVSRSPLDKGEVGKVVEITLPGGVKMPFCFCPAGTFMMGSLEHERDRLGREKQVQLRIDKGFWMAKTECTQQQWKAVTGDNPSEFPGGNAPVETVNWEDAHAFVSTLNLMCQIKGWKWGLPTEAQWEYACRAGTQSAYSFGDDPSKLAKFANFADRRFTLFNASYADKTQDDKFGNLTAPVASYAPNPWGLHDMHGNVAEWVADKLSAMFDDTAGVSLVGEGDVRILRGGSWNSALAVCRSAARQSTSGLYGDSGIGFCPVLVPTEP
jgi:formylglycine-generating enzyme required for sulfatase activity